jgi:hypothetical protein
VFPSAHVSGLSDASDGYEARKALEKRGLEIGVIVAAMKKA